MKHESVQIEQLRNEIDILDSQIGDLLVKRVSLACQIQAAKKLNHLQERDFNREMQIVNMYKMKMLGSDQKSVESFVKSLIDLGLSIARRK